MITWHNAKCENEESVRALGGSDAAMGKYSLNSFCICGDGYYHSVRNMEQIANRLLDDLRVPVSMRK